MGRELEVPLNLPAAIRRLLVPAVRKALLSYPKTPRSLRRVAGSLRSALSTGTGNDIAEAPANLDPLAEGLKRVIVEKIMDAITFSRFSPRNGC